MLDYLQISSEGMNARILRQQVIANNLANVNTAGYKRDRAFHQVLDVANVQQGIEYEEITVFEQGALNETKSPFHFGIKGDGFFVIETEHGNRYTRNGNFDIDDQGQLMLPGGGPVLGEGGPITVNNQEFKVNLNGEILIDDIPVGKLKIVHFEDLSQLKKEGNNLLAVKDEDENLEIKNDTAIIRQGFLEESNVNALEEMINMLTLYREFEADQKSLHSFDQVMEDSANRIGKV